MHLSRGCERSGHFGRVHFERVVSSTRDDGRPGEQGDMGVQRVRRLEQHGWPARAAVREQEALDHLVRAVGAEHLLRLDRVVSGKRRP